MTNWYLIYHFVSDVAKAMEFKSEVKYKDKIQVFSCNYGVIQYEGIMDIKLHVHTEHLSY